MPRYELTYRDAAGKAVKRILFADEDREVADLIDQEGLREVTVRPSLRLSPPTPPPPPASAAQRPKKPGTPLRVEILSQPSDLRGDPTGGKLPWMVVDEESPERISARNRQAGLARSYQRKKEESRWVGGGATGREKPMHERLVDALIAGTLEVEREYELSQLVAILGPVSGGMEILILRLAEHTAFRCKEICYPGSKKGQQSRRFVFREKVRMAAEAAAAAA